MGRYQRHPQTGGDLTFKAGVAQRDIDLYTNSKQLQGATGSAEAPGVRVGTAQTGIWASTNNLNFAINGNARGSIDHHKISLLGVEVHRM